MLRCVVCPDVVLHGVCSFSFEVLLLLHLLLLPGLLLLLLLKCLLSLISLLPPAPEG